MFYALLTDGKVGKLVAFGHVSISLQHVEEWKYYELTNLKSKRHQVHEQLHRVHGHEHHESDRNNEDKRTEDCTQLSGCRGAGRYLLSIDFLTNFFRIKVR